MKKSFFLVCTLTALFVTSQVSAEGLEEALIDEASVIQSSTDMEAQVEPVPAEEVNMDMDQPDPAATMPQPTPVDEADLPDDF